MYSIANIIYGWELPRDINKALEEEVGCLDPFEIEDYTHAYYSGDGDTTPFGIGKEISNVPAVGRTKIQNIFNDVKSKAVDFAAHAFEARDKIIQITKDDPALADLGSIKRMIEYLKNNAPELIIVWSTS